MKLPHHRADDGYVVWRGVAAASGRLDQTTFPSEDMGAVKRHLANHFKEFDREAPWERDAISWSAFIKARNRRQAKSPDPLHDTDIASLLDDYGFTDEAVALAVQRPGEPRDERDKKLTDILSRVEAHLKTAVADTVVLELDDDDDEDVEDSIAIDTTELAQAMRGAVQESVGTMVSAEVRSAINAMRGRLD
jgi:hypothetical protein